MHWIHAKSCVLAAALLWAAGCGDDTNATLPLAGGTDPSDTAGSGGGGGGGGQTGNFTGGTDSAIQHTVDDQGQACDSPADAGGFTFEKIATWRDDAKAAYSMIHDDICDASTMGIYGNGLPLLEQAGLKVGVGPYVEACEENAYWGTVTQFAEKGHTILNHSWTHSQITVENADTEVAAARQEIEQKVGYPIEMFIFPFDAFNADTIAKVQQAGHLASRSGNRDDNDGFENPPINGPDPTNDFELEFDAWPRAYSKYALYYPEDVLEVHAWNAIERGGWAIREFHNVDNDDVPLADLGFGIWRSDYARHLDWLAEAYRKNYLWTAPPMEVVRYRHARTACSATVSGSTIDFGTPSAECQSWHTPISVIVTTANDVPAVAATQGGQPVYTRKIGPKRFSITADPTLGNVELSGCADTDFPTVESGELPPKPQPAASVCDIDTVKGPGIGAQDSGLMDDLTREEGVSLQFFPNPRQDGGRTGSWSWYPLDLLSGGIEMDGGNPVLHIQGGAPDQSSWAWMGVTLAFLGGNGAGACFDGSAYQGIEFRVKGNIEAVDDPSTSWQGPDADETYYSDKIIVCLVTAETQTVKFGGDLKDDKDGDGTIQGGHFCTTAGIAISDSWQTIKVAFSDLKPPTWGDTLGLTTLAKAKLQAVDFGIVNTAHTVDLYLDDIKLY